MRRFRSIFAVVGASIPVLYCFGLVIFFLGVQQMMGLKFSEGLGPTIVGLGFIGLLFALPLVRRIIRLLSDPPSR